jgi:hypothetical protein
MTWGCGACGGWGCAAGGCTGESGQFGFVKGLVIWGCRCEAGRMEFRGWCSGPSAGALASLGGGVGGVGGVGGDRGGW